MIHAAILSTTCFFADRNDFFAPYNVWCAMALLKRSSYSSNGICGKDAIKVFLKVCKSGVILEGLPLSCVGSPTTTRSTDSLETYSFSHEISCGVSTVVSGVAIRCSLSLTATPVRTLPKSKHTILLTTPLSRPQWHRIPSSY